MKAVIVSEDAYWNSRTPNTFRHFPKAKAYAPGESLHRSMERFNQMLKDCIDQEGDFFVVPLSGAALNMKADEEYLTVWQVGTRPGTALLRYILHDYKTSLPLVDFTYEVLLDICGYYAPILPNDQYQARVSRMEEGWKKWRDRKEDKAISGDWQELDEAVGFVKRDPVSENFRGIEVSPPPPPKPPEPTPPPAPVKRKRGRPRKNPLPEPQTT
jgi:hypothetical protein